MHLFCTLYHKRISLWKLHGLWKLQFKNCFRIDRLRSLVLRSVWSSFVESFGLFVLRENFALCLDRFVRLLDCSVLRGELCFVFGSICAIIDRCSVLRGELCFVFGSICAIIGLFRSQGRTLLRVWIDLCDYWTVPFSGENFASCLDRFVRLLTTIPFSGENFASYLDRFVRLLTTIWFSGENFASYYLDRFVIIIDNYLVLRENIASWFALNFV